MIVCPIFFLVLAANKLKSYARIIAIGCCFILTFGLYNHFFDFNISPPKGPSYGFDDFGVSNVWDFHDSTNQDSYQEYSTDTTDYGTGVHQVSPHYVDTYTRDDGTQVGGYWRGGDDGYYRSNPDDSIYNNLDTNSGYDNHH